jgi:hypothetical protein
MVATGLAVDGRHDGGDPAGASGWRSRAPPGRRACGTRRCAAARPATCGSSSRATRARAGPACSRP